ncbi:DUF58 domain-containing protein [Natrialbaceae archaeon A-CW1-1]
MQLTHRCQGFVALALVVAILGATFARPILFAGSILMGAWVLANQVQFFHTLTQMADDVTIHQWPERSSLRKGEDIQVTIRARLTEPMPLSLAIEAGMPTGAVANEPLTVTLDPHEQDATQTASVSWPVSGRHQFESASVTATDGLFVETLPIGQQPTITVEPLGPRHVHVGEGGDRFAVASGEHRTGRLGSGLEPAELREYVPGETVSRMDWKATARLGKPYVRKYEAETHRRTLIVVDHRSGLSMGPPGETKLDYLRDVALGVASSAYQLSDPMGVIAVGDGGITARNEISSNAEQYSLIRRTLLELETTAARDGADNQHVEPIRTSPVLGRPSSESTASDSRGAHDAPQSWSRRPTTPAERRRALTDLSGDGSAFAAVLEPFYTAQRTYQKQIESRPLYSALRGELTTEPGRMWTVILTDDSNLEELYEAVTLARSRGNDVLLVLAPTVLFEPMELGRIERTYDRYHAFEGHRRSFAHMDGVTALEVAPGDRLSAVLGNGRTKQHQ